MTRFNSDKRLPHVAEGAEVDLQGGNANAQELSGANCGVGKGRTVMRSGGQGQHGGIAGSPKPAGRDILSSFGPESKR
jgi:hypothetical protein